ncbi:hypothetical protein MMC25_000082 [Agyrium rufum]|nr:hypothetical protein [Agyrium rufum]
MAISGKKKVLLMTCSEYGQSNVVLALADELLARNQVSVHVASFAALKPRISELSAASTTSAYGNTSQSPLSTAPNHASVAEFHLLPGPSMVDGLMFNGGLSTLEHAPGLRAGGAMKAFSYAHDVLIPWKAADYLATCETCMKIIEDLKPDLIVVDTLLSQGVDACRNLGRSYMIITPLGINETAKYALTRWGSKLRYPQ